jgi:hypothetical protein
MTRQNKILLLLLSGIFLLQLALILFSIDCYGGADNVNHFRISRYAWKYPELFLDLWGKPVYTTLASPFSVFGMKVARLFNVLVGLVAIFFTVKLYRHSGQEQSLLPVVFIAFSPMYFLLMQSCMTEILFSLVLVFSFLLFFKEKYIWAAVVLSFLPFVRSEGIVIFPLMAVALVLSRKYWSVLFLVTGALFFTLVGYPHFKDWLWIVHQTPYSMGASVYGSGSLFHFIKKSPQIFGRPFLIFLVIGLAVCTFQQFKTFKSTEKSFLFWFLISGSFVVFFAAHSYVWWKGTGSSLGLIRVIASVIPLAAIVATVGFEAVLERIKNKSVQIGLVVVVVLAQLIVPFAQHHMPFKPERPQLLMLDAANFLKSEKTTSKIYYFDPYLIHFLNIDPFDQKLSNFGIADRQQPSVSMSDGDILVWDAHFGPNEGGVQLENLNNDPHLQRIKSILPDENFKVLGGYDYGIYIFRKVQQKVVQEKKQLIERELIFEGIEAGRLEMVDGKKSLKMDSGMEFSPAIQVPIGEIKAQDYLEIEARLNFSLKEPISKDAVLLILSVDVDHKSVSYNKMDLSDLKENQVKNDLVFPLKLKAYFPEGAILNLYVWNKDKRKLGINSMKLTINGF